MDLNSFESSNEINGFNHERWFNDCPIDCSFCLQRHRDYRDLSEPESDRCSRIPSEHNQEKLRFNTGQNKIPELQSFPPFLSESHDEKNQLLITQPLATQSNTLSTAESLNGGVFESMSNIPGLKHQEIQNTEPINYGTSKTIHDQVMPSAYPQEDRGEDSIYIDRTNHYSASDDSPYESLPKDSQPYNTSTPPPIDSTYSDLNDDKSSQLPSPQANYNQIESSFQMQISDPPYLNNLQPIRPYPFITEANRLKSLPNSRIDLTLFFLNQQKADNGASMDLNSLMMSYQHNRSYEENRTLKIKGSDVNNLPPFNDHHQTSRTEQERQRRFQPPSDKPEGRTRHDKCEKNKHYLFTNDYGLIAGRVIKGLKHCLKTNPVKPMSTLDYIRKSLAQFKENFYADQEFPVEILEDYIDSYRRDYVKVVEKDKKDGKDWSKKKLKKFLKDSPEFGYFVCDLIIDFLEANNPDLVQYVCKRSSVKKKTRRCLTIEEFSSLRSKFIEIKQELKEEVVKEYDDNDGGEIQKKIKV